MTQEIEHADCKFILCTIKGAGGGSSVQMFRSLPELGPILGNPYSALGREGNFLLKENPYTASTKDDESTADDFTFIMMRVSLLIIYHHLNYSIHLN